MRMGALEHIPQVFLFNVYRPTDEAGVSTERHRYGVEWIIYGACWRRLGDLSDFGCRRVLPFGQAVDSVVEQQDFQVNISSEGMDEMVATDGQAIAVASHYPYVQLGSGYLQTGSNRGSTTMSCVKIVRVYVVREAFCTSDPGDEHDVFSWYAEFGHNLLHLRQNGVVATSRAPAHFLIRNEVLAGKCRSHYLSPPGRG